MEQIGRYKITGEIGRGAMGIVYRALDPAIGRTVAIKTIRLTELVDPSERQKLRDRLFREAQSAGMLSHPGIVTIYDVSEENNVAYIAMEFVNGPTLEHLLTSAPPDGSTVLTFLNQTAAALDYAHKRGIVHRDIKPANIMIHDGATAKITDFGVARIQSHQLTQAGSMVGTPNYMSPEQIQAQPVDGRSDQFSLAVIAYELLTGEKPFSADSIAALAFRIVKEEPEPAHNLNPTLDWPVDTVLKRALAKNPADRYPTCSDFTFALENACRSCRSWKPLPPGAAQDLATVVAAAPAAMPVAAPPRRPETPRVEPAEVAVEDEPEPVPTPLRFMRVVGVVVGGAAIAAALLVGGLQYFSGEVPPPPQTQTASPPADYKPTPIRKPSALPSDSAPEPVEAPAPSAPARAAEPVEESEPPIPAPRKTEQRASAARIITNPPGAYVVVDGSSQSSCTSPCSLDLPAGRHTLSATLAGHRRTLRIFNVPGDSEMFLNLDRASGTVMIRSNPPGAAISVDGDVRRERTPAMLTLPIGQHTIEVSHNGQSETHQVAVRDSAISNVSITFR